MRRTRKPRKGGGATKPPDQHGRTRKVQVVQEESAEDSDRLNTIVELNQVEGKSNSPYTVTVSLDGKPQCLEIDTGACVKIMSENTFNELLILLNQGYLRTLEKDLRPRESARSWWSTKARRRHYH